MTDWIPDQTALRLPRGDAQAWDAFYAETVRPLFAHVQSRLGSDSETTEELIAAIYFEAARSARNYDPTLAPPFAWLKGIARHRISRHLEQRRRERQRSRSWAPDAEIEPALRAAAEEEESPELVRARVASVISELDAEERELLLAKYVDGVSAAELADRMTRTPTAIHSALQRARDKFKRLYAGEQKREEHPTFVRSTQP